MQDFGGIKDAEADSDLICNGISGFDGAETSADRVLAIDLNQSALTKDLGFSAHVVGINRSGISDLSGDRPGEAGTGDAWVA